MENLEIFEEVIHYCLKCRRTILKTKEHDIEFKCAGVSSKGCLLSITFLDLEITVFSLKIEFGKVTYSL